MSDDFEVTGTNDNALFTLKLYRGEGMLLLAMNWKAAEPPDDLVGFAIEYMEPGGDKYYPIKNRLAFKGTDATVNPNALSTRLSPIQKFRWVHFPRNADLPGDFTYRVTPVFMNEKDELSYGDFQEAPIVLASETYPGVLNVAYTRGFVSSQAFVDKYGAAAIAQLLPTTAKDGLVFVPTYPNAADALAWMGFEAKKEIISLLDEAIADTTADVRAIAYDLNEPEVVSRLEQLGGRLKVIIDNSGDHGKDGSAENEAATKLAASAGAGNVLRQKMLALQHNKTIAVGGNTQKVVCGSTNFSWRAFFVQANNAVVFHSSSVVDLFNQAFDNYWINDPAAFETTASADWTDCGLTGIDAKVAFSPHSAANAKFQSVADDISNNTNSNLFYSLAFLYEAPGPVLDAIKKVTSDDSIFVYGISDKKVGGLDVQKPDGNVAPVYAVELSKNLPEPFKSEPTGGGGTRMHHKFVVIDFDKPTARVYFGSYNFSSPADIKNGENLFVITDRRIAVSYMIEAIRLFDHYEFRVAQQDATTAEKELFLLKPPRNPGDVTWWNKSYTQPRRIRDRELFA